MEREAQLLVSSYRIQRFYIIRALSCIEGKSCPLVKVMCNFIQNSGISGTQQEAVEVKQRHSAAPFKDP